MSRSSRSREGSCWDWKKIIKRTAVITWKVIKFTITKVLPVVLKIIWSITKFLLCFAWIWFAICWSAIVLILDPKSATDCLIEATEVIGIVYN